MKRFACRMAALAFCAAAALSLTACGDSASSASSAASQAEIQASFGSYTGFDYENFTYSQSHESNGFFTGVTAADVVTLPEDYAAIPVPADEVTPTEEEVQDYLEQLLAATSTVAQITDRAAADGDRVNIDFLGKVDGVPFTGGEAVGYDLTLGSNTFVGANGGNKGFEEQLVGHTPGETFDITVTFPEGYDDSTDAEGNTIVLSETEAVFTVTLNYISETVLPELTDEWVQANLTEYYGITKADEVDAALRDELLYTNKANYIYNYLMSNSTFGQLPAVVLDYEVCACLDYYNSYAGYYGVDLETFVQEQIGLAGIDALLAESEQAIVDYCHEDLIYQAIAEQMELAIAEEDMLPYADYVAYYGENYVRRQVVTEKVMDALVEGAVVS